MDQKSIMLTRRRLNELASSHNKLTTLVACLLNEINMLKKELNDKTGGSSVSYSSSQYSSASNNSSSSSKNPNKFPTNFNELRAEEILRQLTVNNSDN